jgi:hypothetical protein
MLKILPIQDKAEQELDCARCGITFRKNALAYAASVDDIFIGICQFRTTEGVGEIYDLTLVPGKEDFEALFIMGRAVLNFIDLCGVHRAVYLSDKVDETLMKAIGFSKNENGTLEMDLTDFFLHPCAHHKKD